jgi:NADH-quinone oxidoreductase subunit N
MVFCGLTSLFVGCFGALYQRKIKRLVAYSAISHAGYLSIGIASNSVQSVEAVIFYLIVYIFMGLVVFGIVLNNRNSRSFGRLIYLTEFLNYAKMNPALSLTFALVLFSLAGVPPLAGFLSKMNIFIASISSGLYVATAVALVLSGLGSVYYIRLIKIMYFDTSPTFQWCTPMSKLSAYVISLALSPIILLIACPDILSVGITCLSLSL